MFAYIPARSGSKRIKGKNIKFLRGKPIIAWVIELIKESNLVDKIYVSTDSKEISDIAIKYGANIIRLRDPELSSDGVTFGDLMKYDIPYYSELCNSNECLFVLPTAAMIRQQTLKDAYKLYKNKDCEIVMSTKLINAHWALEQKGKYLKAMFPKYAVLNSQELPSTYIDAGLFYFLNVRLMKNYSDFNLSEKIIGFPISEKDGIDVNTIDEWNMLELKFNNSY